MWTDGRTDMTKLTVAFRNFVKELKSVTKKVEKTIFPIVSK